jgi:hypothetical protein
VIGDSTSSDIHCTLSRRNCGETCISLPEKSIVHVDADHSQALLQARLEPLYQLVKDATLGLIFPGTPHRGSDKATYGKVLANVAQFITHRPSTHLLTALQTNSDILLRLTTDFRFQLPDYQVYSFYEQRPMKGLSSLVRVPTASS